MSDKFLGIRDLLGMRQAKRQSNLDRLTGGLRTMGQRKFESTEAEKQREYDAEQNKLDREYEDTPFADGPREVTDPTTGMTFTATTPREWGILQQQLDIAAKATEREDVQGFTDEQRQAAQQDALERMQEESRLDITMLGEQEQSQIRLMEEEMQNQQAMVDWERAKYENGMYQTQDGAVFRWNSPETYQAALDEINQHTQKLAGLASRNPSVYDVYITATDRAKEQMWKPDYVLDEDTGQVVLEWVRTDVTTDTLLENFVEELPMTGMSQEEQTQAIEAFRTYLVNAEQAPPSDFEMQDSSASINIENLVGQDGAFPNDVQPSPETVDATQGAVGGSNEPVLGAGAVSLFDYRADSIPEGVDTRRNAFQEKPLEQRLYESLVSLAQRDISASEAGVIQEYINTLIKEDQESYPDIQSFISRMVGRL